MLRVGVLSRCLALVQLFPKETPPPEHCANIVPIWDLGRWSLSSLASAQCHNEIMLVAADRAISVRALSELKVMLS